MMQSRQDVLTLRNSEDVSPLVMVLDIVDVVVGFGCLREW
jgi:hypothetical protein